MRSRLTLGSVARAPIGRLSAAVLVTLLAAAMPPVAAAGAAPITAAGARPAAVTAAAGGRYVALGDSYAAGLGITPAAAGAAHPGCGQSSQSYPRQVAAALGLTLVDASCSGATTLDLAGAQQVSGAPVAPQFDSLTADTALVTLTIGGNDLGFSAIAAACASLSGPTGPVSGGQPNCTAKYVVNGTDQLQARLADVVAPAVTRALAEIRTRAPRAKIVVVAYPALTPDPAEIPSAGCWSDPLSTPNALPFTSADLPYLQKVEAALDQTLTDVATQAGAAVAQDYRASLAHTACSTDPWMNGITVQGLAAAPESLHPNLAGATQLAQVTTPIARQVLAGDPVPTPKPITAAKAGLSTIAWVLLAVGIVLIALVAVGLFRIRRRHAVR